MCCVSSCALNCINLSFSLDRMSSAERDQVLQLRVDPSQMRFVEPIEETLSQENILRESHVMLADGNVVGFFQIDTENEHRFEAALPKELELHEVIVDTKYQGRGYGAAFLEQLPLYVRTAYPGWDTLALSVNCLNERAHALYVRGGFSDTGEIFKLGQSGPQYVMRYLLAEE